MLSLVVGDKTNHLRMLVVKQKSNTRKKRGKSNSNKRIVHQNHNRHNNFFGRNSYNQRMPTTTNGYSNNKYQNTRSDYPRSKNSSISSNQLNQSYSSSSKSHSDMKRNGTSHTANSSYGYVTDNLRYDIERYIIANKMVTFCIIVIIWFNCHVTEKQLFIKLLLASHYTTCLVPTKNIFFHFDLSIHYTTISLVTIHKINQN